MILGYFARSTCIVYEPTIIAWSHYRSLGRSRLFLLEDGRIGCSTFFYFFKRGNLESGSFSYMRNSGHKYIRNSAEFREIPVNFTAKNTTEFRGISCVFQKIPYSVGSQKRTSVDTLVRIRNTALMNIKDQDTN